MVSLVIDTHCWMGLRNASSECSKSAASLTESFANIFHISNVRVWGRRTMSNCYKQPLKVSETNPSSSCQNCRMLLSSFLTFCSQCLSDILSPDDRQMTVLLLFVEDLTDRHKTFSYIWVSIAIDNRGQFTKLVIMFEKQLGVSGAKGSFGNRTTHNIFKNWSSSTGLCVFAFFWFWYWFDKVRVECVHFSAGDSRGCKSPTGSLLND